MKSLYEQLASSNLMTACNLLNKSIKDNGGFFDARQKKHLCPMTTSTRAAAAAFPLGQFLWIKVLTATANLLEYPHEQHDEQHEDPRPHHHLQRQGCE